MPFKRQPHKMAKHTQAIRRLLPKELFECVWPFCGAGAWRLMQFLSEYLYFVKAEWLSFNTGLYAFLIYRVHVTLIWPTEAAALGCSVKSLFFKISENGLRPATSLKKRLAQVFSFKLCKIFKNICLQNTSNCCFWTE